MCGIVGIIDWSDKAIVGEDMGVFMQMLHCNAVRGMHGTGILGVDKNGETHRLRAGGPPHVLVGSKEFDKFEKWVSGHYVRFILGHNRYATRGGLGTEHTHPFRDGDITLVHNGTLDSYLHLPDAKKYSVDSEAICHAIAVQGAEKTVQSLRGAWTLVWWDAATKTANFLRNKERPLFMARLNQAQQIIFASEHNMLEWIILRNNHWDYEIKELPENQWFSYSLDSQKPHVKELKGKEAVFADVGWAGYGGSARTEACGVGKVEVEADKKVVQLPLLPSPKQSGKPSYSGTAQSGPTNNRGPLQEKSASRNAAGDTAHTKGYWVPADSIHTITKAGKVTCLPIEYKSLAEDTNDKKGLWEITALSDEYPDVKFLCHVRGYEGVQLLMEAQYGMRADVKSILRSMNLVSMNPHKVYLHNPEPMWVQEPKTIPASAHSGD